MTGRVSGEETLRATARKLLNEARRQEAIAVHAREKMDAARSDLRVLHKEAEERFGRTLPTDALLLDVLALIDIEPGDRWIWRGLRNNKDLAVVRTATWGRGSGSERSVVRLLAVALGVIEEDAFGALYPKDGDTEDVNPWHRDLRYSEIPFGNPGRYDFGADT